MKLKIISLVVVFVFVVSMLPVNLFAHGSHTDCQDGTVVTSLLPYREYNGYHEHIGDSQYRACPSPAERQNNALGSILVIGAIVGLIVWAVKSKKNKTADTSLEEVNPVEYESPKNWRITSEFDYDSYSLGLEYNF